MRPLSIFAVLALSLAATTLARAQCLPACRENYLCIQDKCVSSCNPVCGPNETCKAGACLPAPTAAPPTAQPAPPLSVPPGPGAGGQTAPPPAQPTPAPVPRYGSAPQGYAPYAGPAAMPPTEPANEPGAYLHDGFYLQMAGGVGYTFTSAEASNSGITSKASLRGFSVPYQLLIGGSPRPGITLGGGFMGTITPSAKGEIEVSGLVERDEYGPSPEPGFKRDLELDEATVFTLVGPFVDWYPNPRTGFHVQGMVGLGRFSRLDDEGEEIENLAVAAGVGHDWFVAPQWSIGLLGRVQYMGKSKDGIDATYVVPALLGTFTYH